MGTDNKRNLKRVDNKQLTAALEAAAGELPENMEFVIVVKQPINALAYQVSVGSNMSSAETRAVIRAATRENVDFKAGESGRS